MARHLALQILLVLSSALLVSCGGARGPLVGISSSRSSAGGTLLASAYSEAVKQTAPGVRMTAWAADGVVEAYEAPGVWAVQFHPEKAIKAGDEKWISLFEAFVSE